MPAVTQINPEKLLHSKWTAVTVVNKEKHFLVTRLIRDADENVVSCELEAVINKRRQIMPWQALKEQSNWRQGWY